MVVDRRPRRDRLPHKTHEGLSKPIGRREGPYDKDQCRKLITKLLVLCTVVDRCSMFLRTQDPEPH